MNLVVCTVEEDDMKRVHASLRVNNFRYNTRMFNVSVYNKVYGMCIFAVAILDNKTHFLFRAIFQSARL